MHNRESHSLRQPVLIDVLCGEITCTKYCIGNS